MLVLGRKLGERILVPHCQLALTVVAIEGNTVKLGITAPTDVDVYREELWRKVCAEKVCAPISCWLGPRDVRRWCELARAHGVAHPEQHRPVLPAGDERAPVSTERLRRTVHFGRPYRAPPFWGTSVPRPSPSHHFFGQGFIQRGHSGVSRRRKQEACGPRARRREHRPMSCIVMSVY